MWSRPDRSGSALELRHEAFRPSAPAGRLVAAAHGLVAGQPGLVSFCAANRHHFASVPDPEHTQADEKRRGT